MAKSAPNPNNYISLLDSPEGIRRKIKSAVTDSEREVRYDEVAKPAISNLMTIYHAFSSLPYAEIEKRYSGKSYVDFKSDLAELLVEKLAPIQKKYSELLRNKKALAAILSSGAKKAEGVAEITLTDAKRKTGFLVF